MMGNPFPLEVSLLWILCLFFVGPFSERNPAQATERESPLSNLLEQIFALILRYSSDTLEIARVGSPRPPRLSSIASG